MTSIKVNEIDLDDPRYRIKPVQQMIASCTGALITSFFGNVSCSKRFALVYIDY
jgi:hypothetical protein